MGENWLSMGRAPGLVQGFFLAINAHRYIQHGCACYLDYMLDTRVGDQISDSEVLVVREFAKCVHGGFTWHAS